MKRKGSFLIAIIAESVQRRWADDGQVHQPETPNGLLLIEQQQSEIEDLKRLVCLDHQKAELCKASN